MKLEGMNPAPPVTSTFLATAADYVFRSNLNLGTCSTTARPAAMTRDFTRAPVRGVSVDDQRLFVDALALLLGHDDRLEVIGTAGDGPTAIELAVTDHAQGAVLGARARGTDRPRASL